MLQKHALKNGCSENIALVLVLVFQVLGFVWKFEGCGGRKFETLPGLAIKILSAHDIDVHPEQRY